MAKGGLSEEEDKGSAKPELLYSTGHARWKRSLDVEALIGELLAKKIDG
jgi:hypothetical protein